ncbi:GlsB/YeaQ/YmgE family stress response membrane protein [Gordonia sp. VNK21]|uniref:GlsB/YeaQ/YmgE family stress response membrane protein n=1 Tax=Gordonia sp. VNK21 TaxID=3382483 RepID=UPI0038D4D884
MLSLGFFAWIVIGGLAGWLGSKIMGTDEQQGLLMNIVVGVIGGLIGGMILGLVFDVESAGWFFSFLTCLLGSVILLWVVKKLTGSKS